MWYQYVLCAPSNRSQNRAGGRTFNTVFFFFGHCAHRQKKRDWQEGFHRACPSDTQQIFRSGPCSPAPHDACATFGGTAMGSVLGCLRGVEDGLHSRGVAAIPDHPNLQKKGTPEWLFGCGCFWRGIPVGPCTTPMLLHTHPCFYFPETRG